MCNCIMNHIVVVKISGTWGWVKIRSNGSLNISCAASNLLTHPKSNPHTDFTASQLHKACMTSSARQPQRWHVGSESIFLLSKFVFVGKLLVHAFHRKCLTLPGKPNYFWCNIDDQKTKEKVIAFSLNNIVTSQ